MRHFYYLVVTFVLVALTTGYGCAEQPVADEPSAEEFDAWPSGERSDEEWLSTDLPSGGPSARAAHRADAPASPPTSAKKQSSPSTVAPASATPNAQAPALPNVALRSDDLVVRPMTLGDLTIAPAPHWENDKSFKSTLALSLPRADIFFLDREATGGRLTEVHSDFRAYVPVLITNSGLRPATVPRLVLMDDRGAIYEPQLIGSGEDAYRPGSRLNPGEETFVVLVVPGPNSTDLRLAAMGETNDPVATVPIEYYGARLVSGKDRVRYGELAERERQAVSALRVKLASLRDAYEATFLRLLGPAQLPPETGMMALEMIERGESPIHSYVNAVLAGSEVGEPKAERSAPSGARASTGPSSTPATQPATPEEASPTGATDARDAKPALQYVTFRGLDFLTLNPFQAERVYLPHIAWSMTPELLGSLEGGPGMHRLEKPHFVVPLAVLNSSLDPAVMPTIVLRDEQGATYVRSTIRGAVDQYVPEKPLNPNAGVLVYVVFDAPIERTKRYELVVKDEEGEQRIPVTPLPEHRDDRPLADVVDPGFVAPASQLKDDPRYRAIIKLIGDESVKQMTRLMEEAMRVKMRRR